MLKKTTISLLTLILLSGLLGFITQPSGAIPTSEEITPIAKARPPALDEADLKRAASKMDEELLSQLRNSSAGMLTAIVHMGTQADLSATVSVQSRAVRSAMVVRGLQLHAELSQIGIRGYLDGAETAGRVESYRPFYIFNGLAVTAQADTLWELALREDVQAITANHIYVLDTAPAGLVRGHSANPQTLSIAQLAPQQLLGWNITKIGANQVWSDFAVTGEGVVVANLDSGVQLRHPALREQYAGWLGDGEYDHDFHFYDASGSGFVEPLDDNGNGTHTMGTMLGGDGPGSFDEDIGVAPGARWITAKVFNSAGTATSDVIHAAFEWMLAPCPLGVQPGDPSCDPAQAPHIINNSWGSQASARTEYLPDAQALRAAGVLLVFSAGNNGPGSGTLGSPGSFAEVFSVAATDSDDLIADFSSRGPSPLTAEIKPDVSAPGVAVRSSIPDGDYAEFRGTSMAAPHVSGLAALLLSAEPALDLETLEALMRSSALDLGADGPDSSYGYGRIDAFAAVRRLIDAGVLAGIVRDADTLAPLSGVNVHARGEGLALDTTTDSEGNYQFEHMVSGSYTLTLDIYGYSPGSAFGILVQKDITTRQDVALISLPRFTVSGRVTDAETGSAIANVTIKALETPLPPISTDHDGHYTLDVAAGDLILEAAAFGFATGLKVSTISGHTTLDFALSALPPLLLVDDDSGTQKSISPHVQTYYLSALDANGYAYDYWDIEIKGTPDFDTIRQYPAVVWFGGEFGRIKDISDFGQAQALMDYLDLGGRLLYVAQSHTFYFGDDKQCDSPTWGGSGPCPFTRDYLGVADWVEDQQADVNSGVAGNPVGDGLGPLAMNYPPFFFDFSDDISGTLSASLAFTATDDKPAGEINRTGYTVHNQDADFKTVFMATALEGMSATDAADVMHSAMQWFGVPALAEGLSLAPSRQRGSAPPGESIIFDLRLRNLSDTAERYSLALGASPWQAILTNALSDTVISEIGPVAPGATVDFKALVDVPEGAIPSSRIDIAVVATSLGQTPYSDEALLQAQAKMTYHVLDSDQCGSGIEYDWVDATGGERWVLGDEADETGFISVTLPSAFTFYDQSYDHIWINDHGTLLFGDDNIYDDDSPSYDPPIPNPGILDPNGAIYLAWGAWFWHPSREAPEAGVYTYHDTEGEGLRDRFVVEYHLYENFWGKGPDTFQAILDLNSNEITLQFKTVTYGEEAVVGLENQTGSEGVLYVNEQAPEQNTLHDRLAIHFGVGHPPDVTSIHLIPSFAEGSGSPTEVISYTLTLSNTGNITDSYDLEIAEAEWPTSIWDSSDAQPLADLGPLSPCTAQSFGVQVELPDGRNFGRDHALIRARSQANPLITTGSLITSTVRPAIAVQWDDKAKTAAETPGATISYHVTVRNLGTGPDRFALEEVGAQWPTTLWNESFSEPLTRTQSLAPFESQSIGVRVALPADAVAPDQDVALIRAQSNLDPAISDFTAHTTGIASEPMLPRPEIEPISHWSSVPHMPPVRFTATYVPQINYVGDSIQHYKVEVNGRWASQLGATIWQATPGAGLASVISVPVPAAAEPGDWDRTTVLVTPVDGNGGSARADFITWVETEGVFADKPGGGFDPVFIPLVLQR
ncbi:MAG: S8 family serine peptidase [Chloroflexi bacterium]|nr:S8 family serine peptidase [Chloroflexota bacterium]